MTNVQLHVNLLAYNLLPFWYASAKQ